MNVYCVLSLLCTRLYQLSCKKNLVVFCPHFFSLLLAHKILKINLEKEMLILEISIGKSNNIELFCSFFGRIEDTKKKSTDL